MFFNKAKIVKLLIILFSFSALTFHAEAKRQTTGTSIIKKPGNGGGAWSGLKVQR